MDFSSNIQALRTEVSRLRQLIEARLLRFFGQLEALPPDHLEEVSGLKTDSFFDRFCIQHQCSEEERWALLMALAPHLYPNFYDDIIQKLLEKEGDFAQLGGVRGKNHRGFLPTAETIIFILGGEKLEERIRLQQMFRQSHFFYKKRILWIEETPEGDPPMSGKIILGQEYIDLFTTGKMNAPQFGAHFPAQQLHTMMDWPDLVLNTTTKSQIQELQIWLRYGATLLEDWGMKKKLKPGYRALFHGPPGTGKTLTAALLGKFCEKKVFRIDLSLVVSKYIGETEKNLSKLFDKASDKDWILFFDEADALFGKRTNVKDAHDKYANQEIAYILQKVEDYNGLVILATNLKTNIDDAFVRRFQSIIHFPMPSQAERQLLWSKAFPEQVALEDRIQLNEISKKFKLSGANIMNIVQYCCLLSLSNQQTIITEEDLLAGIHREFEKEGRLL